MRESDSSAVAPIPGDWKRNVAFFLASQALSLFGSALVQYALMWHITLTTKSGTMMALMIILGFLPTFILSPFAGVFADRHNRKRIILIADSGVALATLVLALVYARGGEAISLLLLVSALRSVGQAFHMPAVGAILPQMVPKDALLRVNAVNGSVQSALSLAAPVVAGVLLSIAPFQVIFFVDVATAALAVGLLALFLHVPPHAKAAAIQTLIGQLKAGAISRDQLMARLRALKEPARSGGSGGSHAVAPGGGAPPAPAGRASCWGGRRPPAADRPAP